MIDVLKRLLDYLESSLDPAEQAAVQERHARALRYEPVERLPIIMQYPAPADAEFNPFPHREAFNDPEKMLFNELVHAFDTSIRHHARVGDDLPFSIRANCGTIIIASLFGGHWEQHNDDPPWARPYESIDALQAVFDIDPLDFSRGICPTCKVRSIMPNCCEAAKSTSICMKTRNLSADCSREWSRPRWV